MFIILPITNRSWSVPQLIDVEIFEMLAQPLAALMAKGNNLAMCPRRNRGDVPLMGGAFLIRALGSLVQVCKDRDEGISIRNRF
jgi:hypothetical protein